ncbi:hypothetical protein KSS87_020723 [Heliosperma pusillum]|nr:hypothetical protein KSS87_020723 [Heliosperma pusillum]
MSGYGYPHNQPGYGYGGPPPPGQPYGAPPPTSQPYGAPPPTAQPYGAPPYGAPPHKDDHSHSSSGSDYPTAQPYGKPDNKPHKDDYYSHSSPGPGPGYPSAPPSQYGSSYGGKPDKPPKDSYSHSAAGPGYPSAPPSQYGSAPPYGKPDKPPKEDYYHQSQYGSGSSPFAALMPSTFPPGTDPTVVACFQAADQDGSGLIDDKELQGALSSYNQSFSLRTVHLLMVHFTSSNSRKIGPKEFTSLFYALQSWREIFERFDKDRSGKIDAIELRDALYSLGYAVSPVILDLLVSKFDKTGGKQKAIEYDNFIECCLTVKGLTDKFKEKDTQYRGSATFTYEEFMLTVLPYLVA